MATSKTGGSRAYLRGRVGSDVYSIGKDAKGKKQQVVRSLAESVANPQTQAQMRGRMIMSTVMQAVAAMRPIIDHSFDNVPAGQPNVSDFISRNYALIKDDVANHAASGNSFGLNKYKEKGIKQGAYIISNGSALAIQGIVVNGSAKTLTIALGANVTIGGLRSALGIDANDYFTACAITADGKFIYERFHVNPDLASDTTITAENIGNVFLVEGNTSVAVALSTSNVVLTLGDFSANYGIIVSRKVGSGYQHSKVTLVAPSAPSWTADSALPTYPVGENRFLNGGGDEEEVDPFEPEPFACALTGMTANGQAWAKGNKTLSGETDEVTLVATIDNYDENHIISFGMSAFNPDTPPTFQPCTKFEGATATLTLDGNGEPAGSDVSKTIKLFVDGVAVETWGTITFTLPEE